MSSRRKIVFWCGWFCEQLVKFAERISSDKKEVSSRLEVSIGGSSDATCVCFFTNIDMTPGQQDELKTVARGKGIESVDLFWRERIRLLLDSPEGYGIRLTYLDIPLSDAEQKVFFSKFGQDLHKLITGRLDSVEERMEELHFANWKRGRCRQISVKVKLKSPYSMSGTSHFPYRFMLRLHRVMMYGSGEILFGCYSAIEQDSDAAFFKKETFIKVDSDLFAPATQDYTWLSRIKKPGVSVELVGESYIYEINFGCTFGTGFDDGVSVHGLSEYAIDFCCDNVWAARVERVEVWYDDYLIQEFVNRGEIRDVKKTMHGWPEEASETKDNPYQYWHGWIMNFELLCKRKRLRQF